MKSRELGIYIHIPFCKHKCYYCDFVSYCNKDFLIENYIRTVEKELDMYFENEDFIKKYDITTIYIGGGTPSYIDSKYICEILNKFEERITRYNKTKFEDIEITIEVNPGTINKEKIEDYKKAKINRLSIGLQSTNDDILKEIGRIHNFEQFLETYNLAREEGFDNINVDLMIGIPNQTIEILKQSLKEIIKLGPEHISVYSLILEEGTVLDKLIDEGKLELLDEEKERRMYWYTKSILELSGYEHYEISNFCKGGKKAKHNTKCWEQKEYIGIGAAAHSYLNNIRYSNDTSIEKYIENMDKIKNVNEDIDKQILENRDIRDIHEIQNIEDAKKEFMLLGLRKIEGVKISEFKEKYIDNPIYLYHEELGRLVEEKLLIIDGDYIKLTNKGLDLANLVWEEFV